MTTPWYSARIFVVTFGLFFTGVVVSGVIMRGEREPIGDPQRPETSPGPKAEVVTVLITSSTCRGNHVEGFEDAVGAIASRVDEEAKERGLKPLLVGVALDNSLEEGMTHLSRLAAFDEAILGMNWSNLGVQHYIAEAFPDAAKIPQIVILERTVSISRGIVEFIDERLLVRAIGPEQVILLSRKDRILPLGE